MYWVRGFFKRAAVCLAAGLMGVADAAEPKALAVGDEAPTPVGVNQDGEKVEFKELYGGGKTLVYFFPMAMTPG